MRLSILVCSLRSRQNFLEKLRQCLTPQLNPAVEMLEEIDDGEVSIGDKRNTLLKRATGDYIAFVDDDDLVSHDYVIRILGAVVSNPDCVGIEGVITEDGKNPKLFVHSLQCSGWYEAGGIYYRTPNHLSPVKRELAVKVGFPSKNHGEDHDYSKALHPFLKTEVYLKGPVYFYLYRSQK